MLAAQLANIDDEHDVDDEDGLPVGRYAPGAELVDGARAWERLGVGHRCETWLAWSTQLWCPAVVKLPRPHQLDHPRARRSLGREVAALAGNPHPALPALYVDGTAAATPHIVLEYVDGPALDDEVADHGPLAAVEAAVLGWQLLAALRAVHARGLAHVDVKPENVVLRDGRPVLIDFGSAREIGAAQPAGRPDRIGRVRRARPRGRRTDQRRHGRLRRRRHAARGADRRAVLRAGAAGGRAPRAAALPDPGLGDLVAAMLAPDPHDRPDVDTALADLAGSPRGRAAGRPAVAVPGGARQTPADSGAWLNCAR